MNVIRPATTFPPEVTDLLAGCGLMVRLELPAGSPHVDDPVAGMFRALGGAGELHLAPDPTRLASLDDDERQALLGSLSTTIGRSSYHHQRFHFLVGILDERRRLTGLGRGHDDLTRFALFEAASMLGAIRGAVDEVVYVAARRNGRPHAEAHDWHPHRLIASVALPEEHDVEDIRVLRRHAGWFSELNDYRNALVHRGARRTIGSAYYPVGDPIPEALHPDFNAFLIPDRHSLQRGARPHLWTYQEGNRIEDLVERVWNGWLSVLRDVGATWGGAPTPPAKAPIEERPNLVITAEQPSLFVGPDDTVFVGLFTAAERARAFVDGFASGQPVGPILPIRPCLLGESARFYLSIPSGTLMANSDGLPRSGSIAFAVDLTWDRATRTLNYDRELGRLPLDSVTSHPMDSMLLEIPCESFPGSREIFLIRR